MISLILVCISSEIKIYHGNRQLQLRRVLQYDAKVLKLGLEGYKYIYPSPKISKLFRTTALAD